MGLVLAVVFAKTDYHLLIRRYRLILLSAVILLFMVLVLGVWVNGAKRWLRLGPLSFQPSEMAKLALIIYLAAFLGSKNIADVTAFWRVFAPAVLAVATVSCLILVEPDIGTTALVCMVSWILLYIAGARRRYLTLPILACVPVALVLIRKPYVWDRLVQYVNPWPEAQGAGYQIVQSMTAVGSGGIFGTGLGGSIVKLRFLPEASSDFIFAILAEEMGLLGATVVLLLYAGFAWAGMRIARRAADREGYILACGITVLIVIQAIINIGVVTKALPTKGITLPFISAGGSAVVLMLCGVGILYNIANNTRAEPAG
jgi:cell division protein FtsW